MNKQACQDRANKLKAEAAEYAAKGDMQWSAKLLEEAAVWSSFADCK